MRSAIDYITIMSKFIALSFPRSQSSYKLSIIMVAIDQMIRPYIDLRCFGNEVIEKHPSIVNLSKQFSLRKTSELLKGHFKNYIKIYNVNALGLRLSRSDVNLISLMYGNIQ